MNEVIEQTWAYEEFQDAELWDKRCNQSLMKIGLELERHVGVSFSAACGASLRQSGGEIFSHETTTIESLQRGHYQGTVERAKQEEVVLAVQDTTTASYQGHKATKGLGPTGTDENSRGIHIHSLLVVAVDGLPMGVIGQKIGARKPEEYGKKHRRKSLPIEEKESYKWIEGTKWANERLVGEVKEVYVIGDRESDVFEVMSYKREENVHLLIRATQPRLVEIELKGSRERMRLPEALKQLRILGEKTIRIERKNKSVEIRLEIAVGEVEILPPKHLNPKAGHEPIKMSVIYAREVCASEKEEEPIEWILLCSKPVTTYEEACRCVEYYGQRWKVERFHYTLKEGLKIERLQFDDADTLGKALAVYSVVAWRIMWVTYYGRLEPETPALAVVDEEAHQVLEAATGRPIRTAREVMMAIGKLGGFEGGTWQYRDPGLKSMWIGWCRLEAMKEGWILARNST
jgi:hypothetical protein